LIGEKMGEIKYNMGEKMKVKKFNISEDYERVSDFLSECYKENKNMECWLPERFDDLIFRIDTLYKVERGKEASRRLYLHI
jgi:hypothetical protein